MPTYSPAGLNCLPETAWPAAGGLTVRRTLTAADPDAAQRALEQRLDQRRGMLFFRNDRPAVGYADPPVEITVAGEEISVRALNARGRVLLPVLHGLLSPVLSVRRHGEDAISGRLSTQPGIFAEEERTRQVPLLAALRAIIGGFAAPPGDHLGLYGAFGYDLIFQVDPVPRHHRRTAADRDLVLHIPDEIVIFDPSGPTRYRYEFTTARASTADLPREAPPRAVPAREAPRTPRPGQHGAGRDHQPGEYAELVRAAKTCFCDGLLFEVVPSQSFFQTCQAPPSAVFRRLCEHNPAPYSLLFNLGGGEFLVGASPEMFVRVDQQPGPPEAWWRVQSAPISGTIARGRDALEDAARIRQLLESAKDESELTMCTDVDRNDKSKVCVPGTVRVVERRAIERYSKLIHTADRVEGRLQPGRDALDAFAAHMWAVTVTGAPKLAAIEFIERSERSPRRWYGGAAGRLCFDGSMDTTLTLRTIQIRDGNATVRAGATLLFDSDPEAEEQETVLKASALLDALAPARDRGWAAVVGRPRVSSGRAGAPGRRVLLIDHRDSFVHTLANYLRQAGATATTYRDSTGLAAIGECQPELVVLSPGPGRPADFGTAAILAETERLGIPVFGVCLGLQAIAEYLGGKLMTLDRPVHGKKSQIRLVDGGGRLLAGLPPVIEVGRYHSLCCDPATLPGDLMVTAVSEDGVIMAVEHRERPLAGVQFHPESLMTASMDHGHQIITNVLQRLAAPAGHPAAAW